MRFGKIYKQGDKVKVLRTPYTCFKAGEVVTIVQYQGIGFWLCEGADGLRQEVYFRDIELLNSVLNPDECDATDAEQR